MKKTLTAKTRLTCDQALFLDSMRVKGQELEAELVAKQFAQERAAEAQKDRK